MSAKKALGKRLRARREEAGLTQAEVADRLEVAQETVSRWEGGITAIRVAELSAVAKLLQAPIGWLMAGEGEAPAPYREVPADPRHKGTRVAMPRVVRKREG